MTTSSPSLTAVAVCACILAGCSAGASPPPTLAGAQSTLTDAQKVAVTAAARQMVGDPAAAVHGMKSRMISRQPGIHVCGYVKTPANGSTPLYVELRDMDGTLAAERGQIGATPANLAKVRFMCRQHGDW